MTDNCIEIKFKVDGFHYSDRIYILKSIVLDAWCKTGDGAFHTQQAAFLHTVAAEAIKL